MVTIFLGGGCNIWEKKITWTWHDVIVIFFLISSYMHMHTCDLCLSIEYTWCSTIWKKLLNIFSFEKTIQFFIFVAYTELDNV
jgi:hypothetical protein